MSLKLSGRNCFPSGLLFVFLLSVLVAVLACANSSSAQTLTTLASFNGSNGSKPGYGTLASDANGNLFGTTSSDGAFGEGTVFEIVKSAGGYAATPTILVNFDDPYGANPLSGLLIDANGNLFGTTELGGAIGFGSVFEIAKTASGYASTATTLVSFDPDNGALPQSGLIADSNGDLFGTTFFDGAFGDGTVFEIAKTASGYASTPTTLISFDNDNGGLPVSRLVADSNGDLFGTTSLGGASGFGTVFEIVNTTSGYESTPQTLVSFDGADGKYPYSRLIIDASGDLLGTTSSGGTSGDGTVFEIVNTAGGYSSTPTILVNFDKADGASPMGDLVADSNGNLFGTTQLGGAFSDGTVFEIAKTAGGYAGTPTTVINFQGANGAAPYSGLIGDANGNLFGTTFSGGISLDGTVFEVTGSGFVPSKQFAGTPGAPNCVGNSISALARSYGGIAHAAASLGYAGVADLQGAVKSYCGQ